MEKYRVYELAKELNTTSKRLIEKLEEINIKVKNHMSLLEPEQVEALFDHIGVIRHDKKKEEEEKSKNQTAAAKKPEVRRGERKDIRNAPRIIRTTEIIINTKNETEDKDDRKGKNSYIVRSGNTTGLRPGFERVTGFDYKDLLNMNKEAARKAKTETTAQKQAEAAKAPEKAERPGETAAKTKEPAEKKAVSKVDAKPEVKSEVKTEVKPEVKAEVKPEVKPETTAEAKPEAKTEVKPEVKPEAKPEAKPEIKAEARETRDAKPETKEVKAEMKQEMKTEIKEEKKEAAETRKVAEDKKPSTQATVEPKKDIQKPETKAASGAEKPEKPVDHRDVKKAGQETKKAETRHEKERRFQDQRADHKAGHGKQAGKTADAPRGKILEIPKPEFTDAHRDEISSYKAGSKREYMAKDKDDEKESKREQRKESAKSLAGKGNKRFKPEKLLIGDKKGLSEILSDDEYLLDEFYDDRQVRKTKKAQKNKNAANAKEEPKHVPPKAVLTSITIPETISVKDLAEALKKTAAEVIKKFMEMGLMVTVNQEVDFDTAAIIADEFGVKAEKQVVISEEDILFDESEDDEKDLQPRPPVVVVMGHVDHGKTSLLDAIRSTNVIETEAGGITQHIGASVVKINDRTITFLDTPGHEAFTAMRARGAQVTDIAILVVAADDGVMPQTVEAINHARAANVSIIVAINKIDKPQANPDRVLQELSQHGLIPEEWGGDVICVPVSAKNRINIDRLLEMVLLTADMLELKANPNRQAKGTIIEAKLDKERGPIATLLVQRGTLKVGDTVIAGTTVGHIRAMVDDKGNRIKSAGPSTPVEIMGLPEVPEAGETFYAVTDEKLAKQLVEKRKAKIREQQLKSTARVSLDDLFNQINEGKVKELNIIVKADVQGSVEAVKQSLEKLSNDDVKVKIIHGAVGTVTESDVMLAQVSNAIIIGFNVRPSSNVTALAEESGVDIRLYRVIYDAIEDIQAAMKGMLEPTLREVVLGHAEIRRIFRVSNVGTIGGCYVTDGKIARNSEVRVIRDGIVIYEGKLASLKRFKDDVREVNQGFECGLSIERFNDIKEGDIVESFIMQEVENS